MQYGEPDFYAGHFREITPEVLQDFGVKCVLTDLDETLVGQGAEDPTPEVFAWTVTVVLLSVLLERVLLWLLGRKKEGAA